MTKNYMTNEEKAALETAIKIYIEMGVLNRVSQSTKTFLARVPGINTRRLQTLIKNQSQEIAAMAGAKDVIYKTGDYRPSDRGAFGLSKGGERAIKISPSIEFIF
ncbi:hypothetical protein [Nostoc sp. FACHB-190]|uniref:hypothetical protein n=1 Tax=Nostoc sp. FACHB-190 TaxID=2692838 RepID=UPI001682E2B7|nr:hypothetical protein [Nostoc sp. FACHB-190]MBD2303058.1 hypothetical protein [Nostoc sp. FACHB-190]